MAGRIPVPYVDTETFERNEQRFSRDNHVDSCLLCGRGLTAGALERGWWVEIDVSGQLIPAAERGAEDSQGCFAVGSECAKRIPRDYRLRASELL